MASSPFITFWAAMRPKVMGPITPVPPDTNLPQMPPTTSPAAYRPGMALPLSSSTCICSLVVMPPRVMTHSACRGTA